MTRQVGSPACRPMTPRRPSCLAPGTRRVPRRYLPGSQPSHSGLHGAGRDAGAVALRSTGQAPRLGRHVRGPPVEPPAVSAGSGSGRPGGGEPQFTRVQQHGTTRGGDRAYVRDMRTLRKAKARRVRGSPAEAAALVGVLVGAALLSGPPAGAVAPVPTAPPAGPALVSSAPSALAPPATVAVTTVTHTVTAPSAAAQARVQAFWTTGRMRSAKPVEELEPGALRRGAPPPTEGSPWAGGPGSVKTTGKIFMTLSTGGTATCSAAVVDAANKDVIATAGHCVHLQESGGWAENILFVPGYSQGHRPYGGFVARHAAVSSAWQAYQDPDQDYAFIALAPALLGHVADVVGSQRLSFRAKPQNTVVLGYPSAAPYNGETVQVCSGVTRPSPYTANSRQQRMSPCTLTSGASGGPWYAPFDKDTGKAVQVGVTSGRPTDNTRDLYGAMFDDVARLLHRKVEQA